MKKIKSYIKLMRPQHYIKNILIFLPIVFSKNILNFELIKNTVIGVIAFSLMASIVYIINDIMDVEADRKHEKKKNRPIASGEITIKEAVILIIVLILLTILLNVLIAMGPIKVEICAFLVFYGYLILNVLYSIKLKHVPIIDITILAFGFLLRVIYGAQITGIQVSNWLYLTILSFSFYMGLGKRRNELKKMGSDARKVLKQYNKSFLDSNMYMCMAIGIVFYSLWCIDVNATISGWINVVYTVPFVIVICMKYSLNIEKDSSGDPVDVILGDKILLLLALLYTITILLILYF